MNMTLRERLSEVAGKFHTIEVALFSTFNFNADFFEQNVLPALFGAEPDSPRATRESAVHKGLMHTSVGVFCDPSQMKMGRKPFRYTVYPVFVEGRLFHPKNIILIGVDHQGTRWMYVAAMSANLSLKAWGQNCEGFADTWVHARSEDVGKSVSDFLDWLHTRVGSDTEGDALQQARVLSQQLQAHRSKCDPLGGHYQDKLKVGLYFSPQHTSMWDYVARRYGAISRVRAASPYWGDVHATAEALCGTPVELTAARVPPLYAKVALGQDLTQALADANCRPKISTWVKDEGRFYHAKLYDIETRDGKVAGVGSCNFTRRGLFWAESEDGLHGNVESMLFDVVRLAWPATRPLPAEELPETSCSDDPPQPWPFYVFVQYDWRDERFEWTLQGQSGADIELLLMGQPPVVVNDARPSGQRKGALKSRLFRLKSNGDQWEGVVTELNLGDSTQQYGTPVSADDIIDSWHGGGSTEPSPGGDGDDENNPVDAPDIMVPAGSAEPGKPMFDSFRFYQALKVLRGRILESLDDRKQLIEWMVSRSDSVHAFVNAICVSEYQAAARLVMCIECDALLRSLPELSEAGVTRRKLRSEMARLRHEVRLEIATELRRRGVRHDDAKQMLEWYIRRLTRPRDVEINQSSATGV
ncbi:hypothetical protein [Burkholderia vietnamiensis]|uniref:hypothetical protein n=1 Tax=Burkholderia vietnamiensis TaxID=60552 RepID=UPI001CB3EF71|nr:hypothetical protein [Burkholderia vietnamiensis]CAG9234904.1 conserved hypothetical protein [Burkholderia vietnamiensis]